MDSTALPPLWYRSAIFWVGLVGASVILWSWMDSRYHRTEIASGGSAGIWLLNNRSAVAVGFWQKRPVPTSAEFRVDERDPESFTWIRLLEVDHSDGSLGVGHTLYVPHYMLLPAWCLIAGILTALRAKWKRKLFRRNVGIALNDLQSNTPGNDPLR